MSEGKEKTKELLAQILSDEKLLSSRAFSDKIYSDVPIIRRGSELKKNETPDQIREMKAIAFTSEAQWKTSAWLFYTQGCFMADYTDSFPPDTEFVKYYPTYRDLTVPQLRGYFSWRNALRHGDKPILVHPYLLMYSFELLNCIGTESPEESLRILKKLGELYPSAGQSFPSNLVQWITDFVVYYELPPELISDSPDMMFDKALLTLSDFDSHTDDELWTAIKQLSSYDIDESLFAAQYPEYFRNVIISSFRELSKFFREHRKNTLCDKYFGKPIESQCQLFSSAVFYNRQPLRNSTYELDPVHIYKCVNGTWYCYRYYGSRRRNRSLGNFVRAADSLMREHLDFRYKLTPGEATKNEVAAINSAISRLESEKRRREAARVEIDLSLLSGIRRSADETRDRLLVETDEDETQSVEETITTTEENTEDDGSTSLLNEAETAFIRTVLSGGDWNASARAYSILPAILADSINEKLFDIIGDTVIDFSDDRPELIEDYRDELEVLFG